MFQDCSVMWSTAQDTGTGRFVIDTSPHLNWDADVEVPFDYFFHVFKSFSASFICLKNLKVNLVLLKDGWWPLFSGWPAGVQQAGVTACAASIFQACLVKAPRSLRAAFQPREAANPACEAWCKQFSVCMLCAFLPHYLSRAEAGFLGDD